MTDGAARADGAAGLDRRATVVVVNYDGGKHLGACLATLDPASTLVVDNGSTDGSDTLAEQAGARLLRTGANLGYAGAVNHALPHVDTPYVVVLNMDTRAEPGWLEPLVEALQDPTVGAANPLLLLDGTDGRINAAGQQVTVSALGFNRFFTKPAAAAGDEQHEVGGLHGGAVAFRTDDLRHLGGWDDSGFLYHEDVALSWLLRLTGKRIVCVPRSRVWHDYQLSMAPTKLFLLERNRKVLLRTHLRPWTRRALLPALVFDDAVVWAFAVLRGPAYMKAKWQAHRWPATHRPEVAARRRQVDRLRTVGDRRLLAALRVGYPMGQLVTLARERTPTRDRIIP